MEGRRDLAQLAARRQEACPFQVTRPVTRSGSGFRVQGSGFRVQGSGFRVQGAGCRVHGAGLRVQGAGCRIQGSGFRAQAKKRAHSKLRDLLRDLSERGIFIDNLLVRVH